jgi:hypothetical protein
MYMQAMAGNSTTFQERYFWLCQWVRERIVFPPGLVWNSEVPVPLDGHSRHMVLQEVISFHRHSFHLAYQTGQ